MPADIKIHLHCPCLNDAALLPHFFQRYDEWVDTYHVWDKGSTDGSLALLDQHPKVRVHRTTVTGDALASMEKVWFDEAWKKSRGEAQWVMLVQIDEHLHHPDLLGYLKQCSQLGITAIKTIGYEMVSDQPPPEAVGMQLSAHVTQGCRSSALDRLCIFSPADLTDTHFSPNLQQAWPKGHVVWPDNPEVLLLRFQVLGDAFLLARQQAVPQPLQWTDAQWLEHAQNLRINARTVPGLGDLADVPAPNFRQEEQFVEVSGLFDAHWYLAHYPDVMAQHTDPLVHFCHYGWKEGRQPNPYFDTLAYSQAQGDLIEQGVNPLAHYIQTGEANDARPSQRFDTAWYRQTHQLPADESPLRHFLLRHSSGLVSPKADIDAVKIHGPTVSLATVLALVGSSPDAQPPATVSWDAFTAVVQRFLPLLPFDEQWYCQEYPDIAAAVANGDMSSAHDHFISNGFFEGRDGIPPSANTTAESDLAPAP